VLFSVSYARLRKFFPDAGAWVMLGSWFGLCLVDFGDLLLLVTLAAWGNQTRIRRTCHVAGLS